MNVDKKAMFSLQKRKQKRGDKTGLNLAQRIEERNQTRNKSKNKWEKIRKVGLRLIQQALIFTSITV